MTPPNEATLWGRVLVEELVAGGLEAVCIAPGSRSTPLTVAFAQHPDVTVYSHLDERSASFFALGRARRTGEATALVCTSGTAAANFHPAVLEADQARVPLLVLTADRPHELRDSGANQTVDQVDLYGDAVRWFAELPAPETDERTVRSLRTTAARALAATGGVDPGPVHLNCPFRKPLEPIEVPDAVPDEFGETLAGEGRGGPFVETSDGTATLSDDRIDALASTLESADRPLIVAGPADPADIQSLAADDVVAIADRIGAPIFADPLSSLRFGSHVGTGSTAEAGPTAEAESTAESGPMVETEPMAEARSFESLVCGGYDGYVDEIPNPDVVLRFGASPTSKRLRHALRDADCEQYLLDPAGDWREATFTATNLLATAPASALESLREALASRADTDTASIDRNEAWLETVATAERHHWAVRDAATGPTDLAADPFEGAILGAVLEHAPDPATVFVSNSMPIRDADRFGRPRDADVTLLSNRGASGIDGITSTALGAGSPTDEPLVLVTGDLAFYHDSNGLLAIDRCNVDATIVVLDNDGGGIFHKLPIESFDPPFTDQFKTPHGLEFDGFADVYDLELERVEPTDFVDAYRRSLASRGTQVLVLEFDSEASHRRREALDRRVHERLRNER